MPSDRGVDDEKRIEERRKLIDKSSLSKKEMLRLAELNEQITDLPVSETEDEKIMKQIREAAQLLKEKGIIND